MNDEDLTTAKVDGQLLHGRGGAFDITGIDLGGRDDRDRTRIEHARSCVVSGAFEGGNEVRGLNHHP